MMELIEIPRRKSIYKLFQHLPIRNIVFLSFDMLSILKTIVIYEPVKRRKEKRVASLNRLEEERFRRSVVWAKV